MFTLLHKLIRVALVFFLILILILLTWKKLSPSGTMESVYDMKKETPFISKLYPRDRVSDVKKDKNNNYRVILAEPVYFNLNPNGEFEEAEILVKYRFEGEGSLKIGGLIEKPNWVFDFVDMPKTKEGEWGRVRTSFDMSLLAREGENFRFMFSAPELVSGQLVVDEIRVIFKRDKMTMGEMASNIMRAIIWRMQIL